MAKVYLSLHGIFSDATSAKSTVRPATRSDIKQGKAYPAISKHGTALHLASFRLVSMDFDQKGLKFPAAEKFLELLPGVAKTQGLTVKNFARPRYNLGDSMTGVTRHAEESVCTSFDVIGAKGARPHMDNIASLIQDTVKSLRGVKRYENISTPSLLWSEIDIPNQKNSSVYMYRLEAKRN